jgi:hypothetical protein
MELDDPILRFKKVLMKQIWICVGTGPAKEIEARGDKYSPSHPMEDDEEEMDWTTNLTGMAGLFDGQAQDAIINVLGNTSNDLTIKSGHSSGAASASASASASQPALATSQSEKSVEATKPTSKSKKKGGRRQPVEAPSASGNTATVNTGSGGDGAGMQTPEVQTGPTPEQQATFASIAAQSKEYVRRFKEKKISELEEGLGEDQLAYNVIKKAGKTTLSAPDLRNQGNLQPPAEMGSFFSEADGRIKMASVKVVLGQKKTWSFSFDSNSFECLGCTQHHGRLYFPRRGSGGRGGRQTIWLCDQSMPPMIPVTSSLGCIKIIRPGGWTGGPSGRETGGGG